MYKKSYFCLKIFLMRELGIRTLSGAVYACLVMGNEYQNCMNCHEDSAPEDLVPTRTAAFHQKCMGCHEERGTGPFGEKECKKCHVR